MGAGRCCRCHCDMLECKSIVIVSK
uniref:Uncharacterized protein n=1 Tax=Arundo donax TaxID=35708 RepID=A0A0A9FBJ1_ARUDO